MSVGAAGVIMLLALLAWVWVAGSALARDRPASERFAIGALAACGLAWTALVAGALGIGLLGSTVATAGLALAAAAVLLALRPPLRAPRPAVAPLVTGCVAGLVLSAPQLALSLSALQPSRGDMLWHLGWIHQLEGGAATPGGVYAGEPNGYPWLFHALVAWIAGALPGGAASAVWAMQGFGLACAGTGIWLLATEIYDRWRAATWSVGLFLAAASLGWAADAHGYRFDMATIDAGPFHGSPVPALTPATTFLPPMIPRDLGLALVPTVLWLALRAISGRVAVWWAVGAAGGLVFLIAPPAGLLCAAWVAVLAVMARRRDAWRAAPAAVAVVAPWLVPLGLAYVRYHGFVQTTELRAGTPSAGQSLAAVGLTLPLAAAAMAVLSRERRRALSRSLALVAVPGLAVGAGLLAAHVDTGGIPAALVGWPRYMPFLVLALCVPAGVGADALVMAAGRRRPAAALAAAALLVCLALGSTVLASASIWRHPVSPLLDCGSLPIDADTRVAVVAPEPAADMLSLRLFARSGARFYYLRTASANVRFRSWLHDRIPDLAARRRAIAATLAGGPPPAGVNVVLAKPGVIAASAGTLVASCSFGDRRWDLTRTGPP
jgi:hypothetical protein